MKSLHFYFTFLLISLAFYSCKDLDYRLDDFDTNPQRIKDFFPLQSGKYIIYKLDSTVFTNLGRSEEVHSYQEKQLVKDVVTDNLGNKTYRIQRYIRDAAGQDNWASNGTYYVTPYSNKLEIIDNNQRVINLLLPLKQNYSWKGNIYLPSDLYNDIIGDASLNNWDFIIRQIKETTTLNGNAYPETVTVERINEQKIPDTAVVTNNKASISNTASQVWVIGSPTDTVFVTAANPLNPGTILQVFNRTNKPMSLNKIIIPPLRCKLFAFANNQWGFGFRNDAGNIIDTVMQDPPFANRNYIVDKYARGVGLIYSEFILWTGQPSHVDFTTYKIGYSIRREILDHN